MRKIVFYLIAVLTAMTLPTSAHGESSVEINTNSKTTTSQSSSVKSTTDVHIEINGETKDFHSDGNENVEWKSDDGKSSVKINNTNVSNTNTSPTTTPSSSVSATPFINTESITGKVEKKRSDIFSQIQKKIDFLNNWTSELLKNLFH